MFDSKTITREELCSLFDHTNLKAFAEKDAFETLCSEAADNHFAIDAGAERIGTSGDKASLFSAA